MRKKERKRRWESERMRKKERERESQHPSVSYHHGPHKYICKHASEFNMISTLAAK